jgi:hypothetical protein
VSLTKKNRSSRRASASAARDRARQAASQIGPMAKSARSTAAEQIGPLAKSARITAAQGVHTAREWSAPRVEHAAQSVQRNVAPRVSAALEATAQRIEPAPDKLRDLSRRAQRRAARAEQDSGKRRAMIIAGAVGLLAAVLGAISAVAARRSADDKGSDVSDNPGADPGMPLGDAESGVNGQVPTPTSSS